jgi:hypothetical protein
MGLVFAFALAMVVLTGCDSREAVVPVSGVVTIDGEPAANCRVSFQPTENNENPGIGSVGDTDEEGKFTLETVEDKPRPGAVPGEARVTIFYLDPANFDQEEGQEPVASEPPPFQVPAPWRSGEEIFVVPEEGTDQANFES